MKHLFSGNKKLCKRTELARWCARALYRSCPTGNCEREECLTSLCLGMGRGAGSASELSQVGLVAVFPT